MVHIFIINSHAGIQKFSDGLRNHLAKNHSDIEYHIFHTRYIWHERKLISEILDLFGDEKLRIYCCGGLGTISNAMYSVEDFSNIEFAYCPRGFANDFLNVFSKEDAELFKDIDNLIDGEVKKIDYIKTNHGNCLNNFSVGLDSAQVSKMTQFRDSTMFGIGIPYLLAFFYAILFAKPEELEITIDGQEKIEGRTSEMFFGNGGIIGGKICFDDQPCITDGVGRFVVYKFVNRINTIKTLFELAKKNMDHKQRILYEGYNQSITVRRKDGTPFTMNFDGELQEPQIEWTATIIHNEFPFVLPKGVDCK